MIRSTKFSTFTAVLAAAVLAATGAARAQPDETAGAAFKRGQAALHAGRIHEACQAFEKSNDLESKIDTQLALADCFEQDGKLMAAAELYRRVADKDSHPERSKSAADKASKLEGRAPRLRFAINPRPAGLVIKVDGVEVSGTGDVRVDVGPHEVVATAPGFEGHASPMPDRERAIVDVIVRMEPRAEPAPAARPAPAPAPAAEPPATVPATATPAPAATTATAPLHDEPARDHRKLYGEIGVGAGVAALVGAVVFFEASSSNFDDEHTLCPGAKCATTTDLAKAKSLVSDGRTDRGVSIGMGIGGVALAAAGTYMLLTPHHDHVTVQAGRDGAGLVYFGRF